MRKNSFFVLALFVVSSLFAQDVKFGVKAGVNFAGMSDVELSVLGVSQTALQNDGMSIGYHIGIFTNISFSDFIGFQPELLFSMQGGKHTLNRLVIGIIEIDGIPYLDAKVNYQFGYLSLPLLLEIKPVANLGILFGPQVGYNVIRKATVSADVYKETISGSDFENDFFELNKIDVGAAFGLQYMITENLQIGARYYHGLTDGFKSDAGLLNLKGLKNNVFQVSMGFVF